MRAARIDSSLQDMRLALGAGFLAFGALVSAHPIQASKPAAVAPQAPVLAEVRATPPEESVSPERAADLLARLEGEGTRKAAREELVALGAKASDLLISWRQHESWPIRWEIATISGNTKDPLMTPTLAGLAVEDPESHVRWRSIWAIGMLARADRARAMDLLRASLTSPRGDVRWSAAVGLASMGIADGLSLIHEGLSHPDPWRRWEALHALAEIHDDTTLERLRPFVSSPDPRERQELAMTLGELGGSAAIAILAQLARDPAPDVRARACRGLALAGGTDAGVVVITLLETEQDASVRAAGERAMKTLARP